MRRNLYPESCILNPESCVLFTRPRGSTKRRSTARPAKGEGLRSGGNHLIAISLSTELLEPADIVNHRAAAVLPAKLLVPHEVVLEDIIPCALRTA